MIAQPPRAETESQILAVGLHRQKASALVGHHNRPEDLRLDQHAGETTALHLKRCVRDVLDSGQVIDVVNLGENAADIRPPPGRAYAGHKRLPGKHQVIQELGTEHHITVQPEHMAVALVYGLGCDLVAGDVDQAARVEKERIVHVVTVQALDQPGQAFDKLHMHIVHTGDADEQSHKLPLFLAGCLSRRCGGRFLRRGDRNSGPGGYQKSRLDGGDLNGLPGLDCDPGIPDQFNLHQVVTAAGLMMLTKRPSLVMP